MTSEKTTASGGTGMARIAIMIGLVLLAFFVSYRFATARSGAESAPVPAYGNGVYSDIAGGGYADGGSGSAPSCACCGNGGTGETIEGAAEVEADGIQRIYVDATYGYNPNVIKLAAGVPAEITFSAADGCMAQVMSRDLNFFEDLTTGEKTIALPALEPGTYGFSCGMEMVFGTIVVE